LSDDGEKGFISLTNDIREQSLEHIREPHWINNRLKRIDDDSAVASCRH
jgi:hypothetical protein